MLTMQAAMPAVPPDYMQHCVRLHVPADADLIFLEAAANMCGPTDKLGVCRPVQRGSGVGRAARDIQRSLIDTGLHPGDIGLLPEGRASEGQQVRRAHTAGWDAEALGPGLLFALWGQPQPQPQPPRR